MDYDKPDEKKERPDGEDLQNPWETADFQKFLRYREEKAEDLRILDAWRRRKSRPRLMPFVKVKRMVRMAAVVVLFVAVSIGSGRKMAGAGKDAEPIRWLVRELTYERAVLEPTSEDMLLAMEPLGKDEPFVYTYSKPDDLPGAYRDCFVDLEGLPGLEGYEQGGVTLAVDSETWKISSGWQSGASPLVMFSVQGIKEKAIVCNWEYGQNEGAEVCFREIGGIKGRMEWQPTKEGEKRVTASFSLGNRWYSVKGMLPAEKIERLAAGYAERLLAREKEKFSL